MYDVAVLKITNHRTLKSKHDNLKKTVGNVPDRNVIESSLNAEHKSTNVTSLSILKLQKPQR